MKNFILVTNPLEQKQVTAIGYLDQAQELAKLVNGANLNDLADLRGVLNSTWTAHQVLNFNADPVNCLFDRVLADLNEEQKKVLDKYEGNPQNVKPQGIYYNNQRIMQAKNKLKLIRTNFQYKSEIKRKLGENENERVKSFLNQDGALFSDATLENLTAKLQESNFLCAKFLRDEFQVKDIDGKALTEDSRRARVWYYFFGYNGIVNMVSRAPSSLLGWLSKAFSRSQGMSTDPKNEKKPVNNNKEKEITTINAYAMSTDQAKTWLPQRELRRRAVDAYYSVRDTLYIPFGIISTHFSSNNSTKKFEQKR